MNSGIGAMHYSNVNEFWFSDLEYAMSHNRFEASATPVFHRSTSVERLVTHFK